MKKSILAFFVFIITSCSSNDDTVNINSSNISSNVINPVEIGSGKLFGSGSENIIQHNSVIINQADWSTLINQMDLVHNTSSTFTEVNIDFNAYQLLVSFDQVRENGGYSIEISEVIENQNTIDVSVETILPSEITTQIIAQPFHIVKIPKSIKQVVFH